MKPSPWPDWLNQAPLDLWAKRGVQGADAGSQPAGESLAAHTWLVLERLADLARLRPQLAVFLHTPRLWHCLFWACFLHDLGKAARGFQQMLRHPEQRWPYRHEVLSLAFLDWVAHAFSEAEQRWLTAAIVSHHKEANEIKSYSGNVEVVTALVRELDEPVVEGLWRWLRLCSAPWITQLGFSTAGVEAVVLPERDESVQMVCCAGPERILAWLESYIDDLDEWRRSDRANGVPLLMTLRGLLTTADHAASAHLKQFPAGLQEPWHCLERRLRPLLTASYQQRSQEIAAPEPYAHQRACAERARQSTILIAPTGSGKTEAALYWALGDGSEPVPRLFYVLPYQASMNAMYQRLSLPSYFGEGMVGLQHGNALQTLYQRLLAAEMGPATAREAAYWSLNLAQLHAYPLKVLSPYQLLKVLYRIRGYEGMLADYTQAAFIFDEIHAYDAQRLALIVALIQHLQRFYGARFLIMSATLPSLVRRQFIEALEDVGEPIVAEARLFQRWRRHQLRLLEGDLLEEGRRHILAQVELGNLVLACCNTVGRAQQLYQQLRQVLTTDQIVLLHSRLTAIDRLAREALVMERCAAGGRRRGFVLVATQVVEVSLNLDFDTIYTDPAPLDALVQRFGRVNRVGIKGVVPVHVFRSPQDGQGVYLPGLVAQTLSQLEQHQEQVIDEATLQQWLDAIYELPEIAEVWQQSYAGQFKLATWLLGQLRPFQANAQGEADFARLFDGYEVLPAALERAYWERWEAHEPLEAAQLCVPISRKAYRRLDQRGLVRPPQKKPLPGQLLRIVEVPYDTELGLLLEAEAVDQDE